jgi:hypothetical protein
MLIQNPPFTIPFISRRPQDRALLVQKMNNFPFVRLQKKSKYATLFFDACFTAFNNPASLFRRRRDYSEFIFVFIPFL